MSTTMIPVESSAIKAYNYDIATRVLTVETPTGKTYRYAGVPDDVAAEFESAKSKGRAWRALLIGKFEAPAAKTEEVAS